MSSAEINAHCPGSEVQGLPKHKVKSNWSTFPPESASQCVLLSKFQVISAQISIPAGRAHAIFGNMKRSCDVQLVDADGSAYTAAYKIFPSQPTQVFLGQLKDFFTATKAKGGDVLSLTEVSRGLCKAAIFSGTHPHAEAFKTHLENGLNDATPPVKPASALSGATVKKSRVPTAAEPSLSLASARRRISSRELAAAAASGETSELTGWSTGSSARTTRSQSKRAAEVQQPLVAALRPRKSLKKTAATAAAAEIAEHENAQPSDIEVKRETGKSARIITSAVVNAAPLAPVRVSRAAERQMRRHGLSSSSIDISSDEECTMSVQKLATRGVVKRRTGYGTRSYTVHLAERRLRRKGVPVRAAEGEPNCQAYIRALSLLCR